MIISLLLMFAITVIATWWARDLAEKRGRAVGAWGFATAIFPPIALILWALPARSVPAPSS